MNAEHQSIAAFAVFLLAGGYLTVRWWRNRQRSQRGCGSSGECACPSTKVAAGLKTNPR